MLAPDRPAMPGSVEQLEVTDVVADENPVAEMTRSRGRRRLCSLSVQAPSA
jgi:hypothetical protein